MRPSQVAKDAMRPTMRPSQVAKDTTRPTMRPSQVAKDATRPTMRPSQVAKDTTRRGDASWLAPAQKKRCSPEIAPLFIGTRSSLVVACFDVRGATRRWTFEEEPPGGGDLSVAGIAVDPQGATIAASYREGTRSKIILLSADGRLVRRIDDLLGAHGLAFSPDGTRLYVAYDAESIAVVDVR
jgi:hypothetical protein